MRKLVHYLLLFAGTILITAEKPKLRDWSAEHKEVCSGTYNGRTMAGSGDRYDDLKMYENCTRIHGNLEITHLTNYTLGWTEKQMKQKLTLFDHIEEIKGYLLIYNVDLQTLSFKNLRIIWGDDLLEERGGDASALVLSGNHKLAEVYMPKLRTIHKGNVRIENNTFLCHLRSKVNWDELLNLDSANRLLRSDNAHRNCDSPAGIAKEQCDPSCQYCWSKKKEMCQELYRTVCPRHCSSRQCHLIYDGSISDSGQMECCHDTCTAGCTGPTSKDCVHCETLSLNGSCVSSCPPRMIQDHKRGMLVRNPQGTYQYDRYCVEQCPKQLLIEGDTCVRHCSVGSHHDMTKNTRRCEPCPGTCPKVCQVSSPLTGSLLRTLKDCDEIDGFIEIQDSRMTGPDGFTAADLSVFKSVRMISEYVSIATMTHSPNSMDFLENLEFIEGRSLSTQRHALVITKNDNMRWLGLRKLHTIKAGNVIIVENQSLCYASTVNWTRLIQGTNAKAKVEQNMKTSKCEERNRTCHKECDATAGCWGSGPSMCVACRSLNMNGTCVSKCPEERFFENPSNRSCLPCYEQCLQCKGPGSSSCLSCRHVSLLDENGSLECLEECPPTHYDNQGVCMPCHDTCIKHGCTGPLDSPGPGGCNRCEHALVTKKSNDRKKVERCLATSGAQNQVCSANNLSHYHPATSTLDEVESLQCELCDSECETCTSAGRSVKSNGCRCKHVEVHLDDDVQCASECWISTYVITEREDGVVAVCGICHPLCDLNEACSGPLPTDCVRCSTAGILEDDGNLTCLDSCPSSRPFLSRLKMCHLEDVEAIRKRKQVVVVAAIGSAFLMLILIVTIVFLRCRKIKTKLKKVRMENYGDIPEMKPIDPSVKPNLHKLTLISSDQLKLSGTELGSGEFGVVYAGYWRPKENSKLKVPVAIKLVKGSGKNRAREEADMLAEATNMSMMRHEHLLRVIGVCLHEDGIQMATPLCAMGDLRRFIHKHRNNLGGKDLLLYCYQISSAMNYLFEHRLVHRDLAARNVLVKRANHVVVTDFGLSKMLPYGQQDVAVTGGKVAFKWQALELLLGNADQYYNHSTDVWAFGVTCWEILTYGQSPYQGMDAPSIRHFLKNGKRLDPPRNCSSELCQVLVQCWMSNPDSRPTFVMLYQRFKEFCSVPHIYFTDDPNQTSSEISHRDQLDLIKEILDDEEMDCDVVDPLSYFDRGISIDLQSPGTSEQCQPRQVRRHTSTGSQRYQADPMLRPIDLSTNRPTELGMDSGNYLVPMNRAAAVCGGDSGATLYTPVVVNENGTTELVSSTDYYNEFAKKSDYYNSPVGGRQKSTEAVLKRIQEESEDVEKESCL